MFGALNAAAPPLFLAAIPQRLMGRVMSAFNPSSRLPIYVDRSSRIPCGDRPYGKHVVVVRVKFGPVDTIFAASAVLIIAGGWR
jgi:hypothetical protein